MTQSREECSGGRQHTPGDKRQRPWFEGPACERDGAREAAGAAASKSCDCPGNPLVGTSQDDPAEDTGNDVGNGNGQNDNEQRGPATVRSCEERAQL